MPAPEKESSPAGNVSQATRLVQVAKESGIELFRTPSESAYATVVVGGRRETWLVRSPGFRGWLSLRYREETHSIPRMQAVKDAIEQLASEASFGSPIAEVYVRFASVDGNIYLDLNDSARTVVEVTAEDWRLVTDCLVRFRRPKAMLSLPIPVRGGSLDELMRLLNVQEGAQPMLLAQAWLLSTLQPGGSLPILVLHGEQGSAKSTAARFLKNAIDPSSAPLRSEPRKIDDLMIAATHSRVPCFDNLSHIQPWLSDALCRLSTGGGLSKRELFTDAEETVLEAMRPVILNGIEELATRPDLLDRCLLIYLPAIPESKRRPELDLNSELEKAHPRILGALLDAASTGLRNLPNVHLPELPRMADFAKWAVACFPALGVSEKAFLAAYGENRSDAHVLALDSSPVAAAIIRLVDAEPFEGTCKALLERLSEGESQASLKGQSWPKTPKGMRGAVDRIAPSLRQSGIRLTRLKRTGRSRLIRLERVGGDVTNDHHDVDDGSAGPFSREGVEL